MSPEDVSEVLAVVAEVMDGYQKVAPSVAPKVASIARTFYDAFQNAGFTPDQAFTLVTLNMRSFMESAK